MKLFSSKIITNRHTSLKCSFKISKTIQSGGFFSSLFVPSLKIELPAAKNAPTPPAKNVLIHLGLIAASFAVDLGFQEKFFGSAQH